MPGTYKVVEVAGTSTVSFSDAVKNAIAEASRTLRNLDWFEVIEERGKSSGYGRELSEYGIREFVNIQAVVINEIRK